MSDWPTGRAKLDEASLGLCGMHVGPGLLQGEKITLYTWAILEGSLPRLEARDGQVDFVKQMKEPMQS